MVRELPEAIILIILNPSSRHWDPLAQLYFTLCDCLIAHPCEMGSLHSTALQECPRGIRLHCCQLCSKLALIISKRIDSAAIPALRSFQPTTLSSDLNRNPVPPIALIPTPTRTQLPPSVTFTAVAIPLLERIQARPTADQTALNSDQQLQIRRASTAMRY